PRALPLATFVALVASLRARDHAGALWAVLSLAFLSKIALNVHVLHFGFYLALPAAVGLVALLVGRVPRALPRRGGEGTVFRAVVLAAVAAGVIVHLRWSQELYRQKTFALGRGGDVLYAFAPAVSPVGPALARVLEWIERDLPPQATFVALPEGVMLNYLGRRRWPARCVNLMMTEILVFGEPQLVRELEASRPDYVLLVHKDTREFGGRFGQPGFGRTLVEWVARSYAPLALVGGEPFVGDAFGIRILARKE
ncbi:MAG TPA: hypothetical protein VJS92_03360, partial [Candidatus Polarisedimenticolaceae bacterium]|nr:hypothetical protein [Candidatus Polarisedimenticolaceae bacterium]